MTIQQLRKAVATNPSVKKYAISGNTVAKNLASMFGLKSFRMNGTVYIEAEDGIAECFCISEKKDIWGVREAECN